MRLGIPPVGPNLATWANDLRRWLERSWGSLTFRSAGATATQDGLLLWDAAGYPVVSHAGEWRRVVILSGVPATAAATGSTGEIAIGGGFIYVCTATDTWQRVGLATW